MGRVPMYSTIVLRYVYNGRMNFNFETGPEKIWVDRFYADSLSNGLQRLQLQSAGKSYVFLIPLDIAKKYAKLTLQHVESFEKTTGQSLDDRLDNEPLKSDWMKD